MNIIVAGAGEVGVHLAKMLSKENHNIIVLDEKEEILENLNSNYDLMTVIGSPTCLSALKDAGCSSSTDLFIAVTPEESRNLTSCILASKLGVKKTVARIENAEYLHPDQKAFFEQLGISSLICPEILAAREIADSLIRPWVRQWHEFNNGTLILIGVKVREEAKIVGKELMTLFTHNESCRIAAIKRGKDTIIPGGHDKIETGDMVYFVTTKDYIETVRKMAGKPHTEVRNVMIMGGSRIAMLTAEKIAHKFDVKILEVKKERSDMVKERLRSKAMVILGDGRDIDLLHDEGIEHVEAYIALTGNSETNILSCLAAKRFQVQRTVAEVENNDYIPLAEGLDIGIVINKKLIAAGHIYQMMLDADVSNMKCLTFADAEVAEFVVREGAKITKSKVMDLRLPENVSIGGLTRGSKGIIVYGNTQILPGDRVVLFCPSAYLHKVEKFFK
ncbi:MAG: Trk system potassium transporter TrkA [Bacteroidales bacterium]